MIKSSAVPLKGMLMLLMLAMVALKSRVATMTSGQGFTHI